MRPMDRILASVENVNGPGGSRQSPQHGWTFRGTVQHHHASHVHLRINQCDEDKQSTDSRNANAAAQDDETSTFKSQTDHHHETVAKILGDDHIVDVEFIVGVGSEKRSIPAMKCFLAKASPVFEAQFYGPASTLNATNLNDSDLEVVSPNGADREIILIKDADANVFEHFIHYTFTGQLTLETLEAALQMLYLATKYEYKALQQIVSDHLASDIHKSRGKSCFMVMKAAKMYGIQPLLEKSLEMIDSQGTRLLKSDAFLELEEDLVQLIFSRDSLRITNEVDVFLAAKRWAEARLERVDGDNLRYILAPKILPEIRFPVMNIQDFCKYVVPTEVLVAEECLKIYGYIIAKQTNGLRYKTQQRFIGLTCGEALVLQNTTSKTKYLVHYSHLPTASTPSTSSSHGPVTFRSGLGPLFTRSPQNKPVFG